MVQFLVALLSNYVHFEHLDVAHPAPFKMRLETSSRQPDILYISRGSLHRFSAERLHGPDLNRPSCYISRGRRLAGAG